MNGRETNFLRYIKIVLVIEGGRIIMLKEIIEEYFRAGEAREIYKMVDFYAENGTFQFASMPPSRGKAEINKALSEVISQLPEDFQHVCHYVVAENFVVPHGVLRLKYPDGRVVDWPFCDVFEFKGNKIKHCTVYGDTATFPK